MAPHPECPHTVIDSHLQHVHRVLDRRRHRVVAALLARRGHEVADVAHGEQVAGTTGGDHAGDEPGVGAGEEELGAAAPRGPAGPAHPVRAARCCAGTQLSPLASWCPPVRCVRLLVRRGGCATVARGASVVCAPRIATVARRLPGVRAAGSAEARHARPAGPPRRSAPGHSRRGRAPFCQLCSALVRRMVHERPVQLHHGVGCLGVRCQGPAEPRHREERQLAADPYTMDCPPPRRA